MNRLRITLATFVVFSLMSGCVYRSVDRNKIGSQYVHITVTGEVKKQGQVAIKKDFTQESFLDAVGGFTYGSNMGATPTHFKLKRHYGLKAKEWKIKFSEMPSLKAKGFSFEDGDIVEVPRLLF